MKIRLFKRFNFLHRRAKSESAALPAADRLVPPSLSADALRSQIGAPYAVSDRVPYLPGPSALPPLIAVPALTLSPPAAFDAPPAITLTAPSPLPGARAASAVTLSPPKAKILAPPIVLADPPVSPDFAAALQYFAASSPPSHSEPEHLSSMTPETAAAPRLRIEELESRNATLRATNHQLEQAIKDTTFELSAQRADQLDALQQLRDSDEDIQRRKHTVVACLARLRTFAQALRDLDLDKARSNPRAAPIYDAASHSDLIAVLAANARAAAASPASPWAEIMAKVEGEPTSPAYTKELEAALRIRQAARRARRLTRHWIRRAEACGVDVEGVVVPSLSAVSSVDGLVGEKSGMGEDGENEDADGVRAGSSTSTMASVADDPFKFDAPTWGQGRRREEGDGGAENASGGMRGNDGDHGVNDGEEVNGGVERDSGGEVGAKYEGDGHESAGAQVAEVVKVAPAATSRSPSRLPLPTSSSQPFPICPSRTGILAASNPANLMGVADPASRGPALAGSTHPMPIATPIHSPAKLAVPVTPASSFSEIAVPALPKPAAHLSKSTNARPAKSTPSHPPLPAPSHSPKATPARPKAAPVLPPLASQVFHEEMRASRSRERISLGSLASTRSRERMGSKSQERVASKSRERPESS
ncbi:hypothetical protein HDZ31DRAFT_61390 [Schizophyllum fasciatum]